MITAIITCPYSEKTGLDKLRFYKTACPFLPRQIFIGSFSVGAGSPPEPVLSLAVLVVVILALVVGALADSHLDPLATDVADVEIAQIDLVALRPVLRLALAPEGPCVFVVKCHAFSPS